jgi:tetratricopeptide (TPR) repeat protein
MPEYFGGEWTLGSWLRRQREAVGLTQEELAVRSGLSVRTISNLEHSRSRRPYPASLRRIGHGLGMTGAAVTELIANHRVGWHGEPTLASAPAQANKHPVITSGGERGGIVRGSVVVPRQLPPAAGSFAGRTAELALLDKWLEDATNEEPGGTVVISAIGGMPGVGKTALALHWAHRVAGRFPDGQLYANLRGYDAGGRPAGAAEVVRGFLHGLGVAPERIPAAPDDQAALYRSMVADRRMLIVADNARNPTQVRPLLPGTPGSVVVVTSRGHLGGLAAGEGARMLKLDVLTDADAAELLSARLGRDRVAAEPQAVAELIRLCGRLPLALAIVAAQADLSGRPLAALASQLADAGERLGLLGLDDPAADVRAVFSWSCQQLTSESARMFRLLAVHPGPDISATAAASLADVPLQGARVLLDELAAASMVAERALGRYSLHDLLRAYAAEQVGSDRADAERGAAAIRDHYLLTALAAARVLEQVGSDRSDAERLAASAIREYYLSTALVSVDAPDPSQPVDDEQALAWFDAEHNVLLAIIAQAFRRGSDEDARQLAGTLEPFFFRCSNWHELAVTQQTVLECSGRLGDLAGQAHAHLYLGKAFPHLGREDPALAHLTQAADLSCTLGDRSTEARVHLAFSLLAADRDLAESVSRSLRALQLAEADDDLKLMAHACNNLGYLYALQGQARQALAFCRRALDVCYRRTDRDLFQEAHIHSSFGYAYDRLGNQRQATASFRRAVRLFRSTGASYLAAFSLGNLGDCLAAAGDAADAADAWQQALTILEELGHPDASHVRRKLTSRPSRASGLADFRNTLPQPFRPADTEACLSCSACPGNSIPASALDENNPSRGAGVYLRNGSV